jgi:hypothetical protein
MFEIKALFEKDKTKYTRCIDCFSLYETIEKSNQLKILGYNETKIKACLRNCKHTLCCNCMRLSTFRYDQTKVGVCQDCI